MYVAGKSKDKQRGSAQRSQRYEWWQEKQRHRGRQCGRLTGSLKCIHMKKKHECQRQEEETGKGWGGKKKEAEGRNGTEGVLGWNTMHTSTLSNAEVECDTGLWRDVEVDRAVVPSLVSINCSQNLHHLRGRDKRKRTAMKASKQEIHLCLKFGSSLDFFCTNMILNNNRFLHKSG